MIINYTMPYLEKPIEKLYYTIGEVAEMLGENASLVRFWASSFPEFIKPARNKKGNRLFTQQDVTNFKFIHNLVKERGMTLEGAAKRMKENRDGDDKRIEVIERLTAIKRRLLNITDEYSFINDVEEAGIEPVADRIDVNIFENNNNEGV